MHFKDKGCDEEILESTLEELELKVTCGLDELRTHQVTVLDMFIGSPLQINCMELYPNFGKSMLIGIIAYYIWKIQCGETKVLVLEPNEGLSFTHKKKFCKHASKIDAKKFTSEPGIWYCTFDDFFDMSQE